MTTANLPAERPATIRDPANHFHRNLTSLLITSRLIGESLTALHPEFSPSSEVVKKINQLVTTGEKGETELKKPIRDAGIVLPTAPEREHASKLVASLYQELPAVNSSPQRASEVVDKLRLLAQHLELRARIAAEGARLLGEEPLRRVLSNWARQWWHVSRA